MPRIKLSPDVAALNPGMSAAGAAVAGEKRPRTAKAEAGGFTNRLEAAARRGWVLLESPDAVRYRLCAIGGPCTPWGSYDEATAYAAANDPEPTR